MSFDDEKKRKALAAKESPSSQDALQGKGEIEKLKMEIERTKREEGSAQDRQTLIKNIEDQKQKSAPVRNEKKEISSANTKPGDTKEFSEKQRVRQEEIEKTLQQAPEQGSEAAS